MSRKRGRITVQEQPTKQTRAFQRLAMLPFLVVSLFFVIIGITEVIPAAGLFGVVWTFVAGCFVIIAVFQMVRKNGVVHRVGYDVENDLDRSIVGLMEDVPEEEFGENAPAPAGTTEARLLELQSLYDRDLITHEEYEAKRKDILSDL
ncbi:MAG: SHOCT domain-containing protein [Oscillibacter sp.]|nr:SHOCT domain-containing protein [Oscillibacter sp.]